MKNLPKFRTDLKKIPPSPSQRKEGRNGPLKNRCDVILTLYQLDVHAQQ